MHMMRMRNNGAAFVRQVVQAIVEGQSPEEFAEQALRRMNCPLCRDGLMPLDEDGNHTLLGITVPCGAVQQEGPYPILVDGELA